MIRLLIVVAVGLTLVAVALHFGKSWACEKAGCRPSAIVCAEDMPCWNCETMGNRICGLGNRHS